MPWPTPGCRAPPRRARWARCSGGARCRDGPGKQAPSVLILHVSMRGGRAVAKLPVVPLPRFAGIAALPPLPRARVRAALPSRGGPLPPPPMPRVGTPLCSADAVHLAQASTPPLARVNGEAAAVKAVEPIGTEKKGTEGARPGGWSRSHTLHACHVNVSVD